jgi:hypothetical protein
MAVAILDTSIYIDHWERGLYQETLENLRRAYIIRHSAVVLSELRRGARGREAERLLTSLFEMGHGSMGAFGGRLVRAGRLIRKIGDTQNWDINKRRDFQKDALIALKHGATEQPLLLPIIRILSHFDRSSEFQFSPLNDDTRMGDRYSRRSLKVGNDSACFATLS